MLQTVNNQLFAMEPGALEGLCERVSAIKPELIAALDFGNTETGTGFDREGSVAKVYVSGVLLRSTQVAQFYRSFGEEATSYGEIQGALAAANADPAVSSVLLVVDSPGGQVSGVHAAADAIRASAKPVKAHIETLGASAAYWLASQADSVSASRGAQVGSIGAYMAVADMSKMANDRGVKIHVVSSGPHKGAGVPGAPVTESQLAEMQRRIDAVAAEFVTDVANGRGTSPTMINESADGRVYSATEAIGRNLIDCLACDPVGDMKMADAMKDLAALVKEHPAHAALIADKFAAGFDAAAVKAEIAGRDRESELAKIRASLDDVKAELAKREAAVAEANEKVAKAEKERDDAKAAHDALKKLGAGAKAADDVKPEKVEAEKAEMTLDEYNALDLAKKSAFVKAGGVIK